MHDPRSPLVYQSFIARALGMSWSEARAFVEAQGCKTYPRGRSPRTWAMARTEWNKLADQVGATTPELADRRIQDAIARADAATADPNHPARRRRARRH